LIGNRHLGVSSVKGRSLSPRPATRRNAFRTDTGNYFYYSDEIILQSIFVAACSCCHTLNTSANLFQNLQRELNSRTGQAHTERLGGDTRLVHYIDIWFMIKKEPDCHHGQGKKHEKDFRKELSTNIQLSPALTKLLF